MASRWGQCGRHSTHHSFDRVGAARSASAGVVLRDVA